MSCFRNGILFAAIFMLSQQQVNAASKHCNMRNGTDGICIPVNECPAIKALILQQVVGHEETTCGWKDSTTPLVCCKPHGNTISAGNVNNDRHPIMDKNKDSTITLTKDNLTSFPLPDLSRKKISNKDLSITLASIVCQSWIDEFGQIDNITSEEDFDPFPLDGDNDNFDYYDEITDSPLNLTEGFVSKPAYDFRECGSVLDFEFSNINHQKVYCLNETADKYTEMGYTVTPLSVNKDKITSFQVSNTTHKKVVTEYVLFAAVGGGAARRVVTVYMALLGFTTANVTNWLCDGVIINRNWILTAAHCLLDSYPDVIRLGEYDLGNDTITEHEFPMEFGVEGKPIIHPNYSHPSAHHDLALIRLDREIPYFRQDMIPICLPWGNEANRNFVGEQLTLTGWGATIFHGRSSPVVQEVNVTGFDASYCDKGYSTLQDYSERFPNGIRPDTVLCAGDPEGGKDACQGDSGGPLVYLNGYEYTLAGIVSTGYGCGLKDFPGIYVPINRPEYLTWIKKIAFP